MSLAIGLGGPLFWVEERILFWLVLVAVSGAGVGRDFLRNLFFMWAGFRTFSPISGSRTGKFSNCDVPAPGSLLLLVLALVSLLLPLCGLTTSRLLGKCCNNS